MKQTSLSAFFKPKAAASVAPAAVASASATPLPAKKTADTPPSTPGPPSKRLRRILSDDDDDDDADGSGSSTSTSTSTSIKRLSGLTPPPSSSPVRDVPAVHAPAQAKKRSRAAAKVAKQDSDGDGDGDDGDGDEDKASEGKKRIKSLARPAEDEEDGEKDSDAGKQVASRQKLLDNAPILGSSSSAESQGKLLDIVKRLGAKEKYTPLEKQVIDIKGANPDTILLVEVGYRYRFFAEDAETAAKVLNVVAFPDKHFLTASIPTHRLRIHVGRLVSAGFKVGVVSQTETAALKKVSTTKSTLFTRQLTGLYTKATMIDETYGAADEEANFQSSSTPSYLMAIVESPALADASKQTTKAEIAIVAVQASTGDVVFDAFSDNAFRSELETRILHLQIFEKPSELLLPRTMSKQTEKLLSSLTAKSVAFTGDGMRIERLEHGHLQPAEAATVVADFVAASSTKSETFSADALPPLVQVGLAALMTHLRAFGLERVLGLIKYFAPFTTRRTLTINADTLHNLELIRNETDGQVYGSLLWLMDHTSTPFGKRMLQKWVSRPLLVREAIEERLAAVSELVEHRAQLPPALQTLEDQLASLPDLERALARLQYLKVSPKELVALLRSFDQVTGLTAGQTTTSPIFKATMLESIWKALQATDTPIRSLLAELNTAACEENRVPDIFVDQQRRCPLVHHRKLQIDECNKELQQHLVEVRGILRKPLLEYKSVSDTHYLIEVDHRDEKLVPANWVRINSTKQFGRYHTPFVRDKLDELARHQENLKAEAGAAFRGFLETVVEHYEALRDIVVALAQLDCLRSLAIVAGLPNYCKPELSDESSLEIIDGRHPMVEATLKTSFVPNNITFKENSVRQMIITGPNMGGKSSYIRQVALISIMAQIGSYVPATSARVGILDGIYTRMGASDNIARGRSTFMSELQETSDIMKSATRRSLVILDELGRGTSTHDGVAIAYATLHHFITEKQSLTLFVTHYPSLAQLQSQFPDSVRNFHMSFVTNDEGGDDSAENVTFLYKLVERAAQRSYGLNVARLAHLPANILHDARAKSIELEQTVSQKTLRAAARSLFYATDAAAVKTQISSLLL